MAGFLNVHTKVTDPNTGEERLVKVEPYLRIRAPEGPTPLFLKGGKVCDENGKEQKPVPAWVWRMAAHCSDAALREAGFEPEVVRNLNTRLQAVTAEPETAEEEQLLADAQEETDGETQPAPAPQPGGWRARAKAERQARAAARQK